MKKKVLIADTRARERGAGIPLGFIDESSTPEQKKKFMESMSSLGNSKNAFFMGIMKDGVKKTDLMLEELKNQNDNKSMIEYYDKCIFYNTQTHFVLSGIGETGSRAAAAEQKTPYINRVNQELEIFDEDMNWLFEKILNNSYLGNFNSNEIPVFETEKITLKESITTGNQISDTAQSLGITKDSKLISKTFGSGQIIINEKKKSDIIGDYDFSKMSEKCKVVFDFKTAADNFDDLSLKAENIINDVYSKAIADLGSQLQRDPGQKIQLGRFTEIKKKIEQLFDESYKLGEKSIKKELENSSKLTIQLDVDESKDVRNSKLKEQIILKINSLWDSTNKAVEEFLITHNESSLDKLGGTKQAIIKEFSEGQKNLKKNLVDQVLSGYTAARVKEIIDNADEIEELEYTAIMDKGTCENCAPLDGSSDTLQGWIDAGMNITKDSTASINPYCLGAKGGRKCRCQLVPIRIKTL